LTVRREDKEKHPNVWNKKGTDVHLIGPTFKKIKTQPLKTTLTGNARHLLGNALSSTPFSPFLFPFYILIFLLSVQVLGRHTTPLYFSCLAISYSWSLAFSALEISREANLRRDKWKWVSCWSGGRGRRSVINCLARSDHTCMLYIQTYLQVSLAQRRIRDIHMGFAFGKSGLGEEFTEANKL